MIKIALRGFVELKQDDLLATFGDGDRLCMCQERVGWHSSHDQGCRDRLWLPQEGCLALLSHSGVRGQALGVPREGLGLDAKRASLGLPQPKTV